jgi:hypothetical protein
MRGIIFRLHVKALVGDAGALAINGGIEVCSKEIKTIYGMKGTD